MKNYLASFFIVAILSGCAAPVTVNHFEGEKSDSEIAILYNKDDNITIQHIDNKWIENSSFQWHGSGNIKEARILPGEHIISGVVYIGKYKAVFQETYTFVPGKKYKLKHKIFDHIRVKVFLVEADDQ